VAAGGVTEGSTGVPFGCAGVGVAVRVTAVPAGREGEPVGGAEVGLAGSSVTVGCTAVRPGCGAVAVLAGLPGVLPGCSAAGVRDAARASVGDLLELPGGLAAACAPVAVGNMVPAAAVLAWAGGVNAPGETSAGADLGVSSIKPAGDASGDALGRAGVPATGAIDPDPPPKYELSLPMAVTISERRGAMGATILSRL